MEDKRKNHNIICRIHVKVQKSNPYLKKRCLKVKVCSYHLHLKCRETAEEAETFSHWHMFGHTRQLLPKCAGGKETDLCQMPLLNQV